MAQLSTKRLLTEAKGAGAIAATGSLSFDPTLLPFTGNSPWRLGISEDAKFAADNDARNGSLGNVSVANSAWINYYQYSHPIAFAADSDPLATITDTLHTGVDFIPSGGSWPTRVPAAARIAGGTDRHMHVITPDRKHILEHFGVARQSSTAYTTTRRHRVSLTGSGIGPLNGTRAYGGSAVGGLIRTWEIDPAHPKYTGRIDHALAIAIRSNQALYTSSKPQEGYGDAFGVDGYGLKLGYVWPATEQDYNSNTAYTGPIPMGSYFAIKPGVDLTTLGLTTAAGMMIAKACQDYGVYVTDTSGTTCFYVEDDGGTPSSTWAQSLIGGDYSATDLKIIFSALRVVTSNNATTPNGGPLGAPRRGSAPASSATTAQLADLAGLVDARSLAGTTALMTAGTLVGSRRNTVDGSGGAFTATLPAPAKVGQVLVVERIDTATTAVTVAAATGATLRGNASGSIVLPGVGVAFEGLLLVAESMTSWYVAAGHKPKAWLDAVYAAIGAGGGGGASATDVAKLLAAAGYAGTLKGAWAASTAYAVGDVVTVDDGVFICTVAHTSITQGFRYDREKWAALPMPALSGGTRTPVRQLATTNVGAGITAPLTASPFSQRPKRIDYSAERTLCYFAATSDVTLSGGTSPSAAVGTQVGGSLVLTSSANTSQDVFVRPAAFASPVDISNSNLRMQVKLSAISNAYIAVQVTSAAGGTDFTNAVDLLVLNGSVDGDRVGIWHTIGCPTSEGTVVGTGADLTAITGTRIKLYWSSPGVQFTVETNGVRFLKHTAPIAKCILWLDDGFASHLTGVQIATKYNLPVTLASVAENFVNNGGAPNLDQARHVQDYLRGQVAIHAYGAVDHNRPQTGSTLYEQLLSYQHFGLAAGLTGVEDMAYWSSGFESPGTTDLDMTVRKLFRSARGGKSRLPETLPPTDPWNTRALMTSGSDTSTGKFQPYAQRAIAAKGLAQYVWHDMTGSVPTEFEAFCAWLDANRGSIQVVTPQQAFDSYCVPGGPTGAPASTSGRTVRVYSKASTSGGGGGAVQIALDGTALNDDAAYYGVANNTVTVKRAGLYLLNYYAIMSTTGSWSVFPRLNGNTMQEVGATSGSRVAGVLTARLAVGDAITFWAYGASSFTVQGGTDPKDVGLSISYLGS